MKDHEFDNSDMDGNYPECDCVCGTTLILQSTLENICPNCGKKYNGSGQRIKDQWRSEALRRGNLRSDPGVGRPGH